MLTIKVLGICGSPRHGNSYFLLENAVRGAKEVNKDAIKAEIYSIKGKTFHPCIACSYCGKHEGKCVHKEDDFEELREKWLKADVILYSLPVYHMSIPGQLKCFIDRLGNSMFGLFKSEFPDSDKLPKMFKIIGSIAQGCHIFSGQEHTITDLINHAIIMQSIPVAGDMWESYIGAGGWTAGLIERNAMEKLFKEGDMSAEVAVKASRTIGRRAVEMAMIIQSGLIACEDMLKENPIYHHIFSMLEEKKKESK